LDLTLFVVYPRTLAKNIKPSAATFVTLHCDEKLFLQKLLLCYHGLRTIRRYFCVLSLCQI